MNKKPSCARLYFWLNLIFSFKPVFFNIPVGIFPFCLLLLIFLAACKQQTADVKTITGHGITVQLKALENNGHEISDAIYSVRVIPEKNLVSPGAQMVNTD